MTENQNWPDIGWQLDTALSDEALRCLCYDEPVFKPIYRWLKPDTGKAQLINRLVRYAKQKSALEILLAWAEGGAANHTAGQAAGYARPDTITAVDRPAPAPPRAKEEASKPTINVTIGREHSGAVVIGEGNTTIIDSDQAVVGEGNVVNYGVDETELGLTYQEQVELEKLLAQLRQKIETDLPATKKDMALAHLSDLAETLTAGEPDLYTLLGVRRWFHKNVPSLAAEVTYLVTHPLVKKLFVATKDEHLIIAYERHFG